nr:RecName: Full=Peptide chain release factor 2; Short=RF-2 [Pseudomonas aeruginosa PAO1]
MEINPILNSIKDLSERTQTIRGYLLRSEASPGRSKPRARRPQRLEQPRIRPEPRPRARPAGAGGGNPGRPDQRPGRLPRPAGHGGRGRRRGRRRRRCQRSRASARDPREAGVPPHVQRRDGPEQRLPGHPGRLRRHRGPGLGQHAAAHVPALGRQARLRRHYHRAVRGRGRRHQGRHRAHQGRVRLRLAAHRDRRAPPGAQESVRLRQPSPHLVHRGVRIAGNRRQHRDRDQPGRPAHRYLPLLRRGRSAREHHRFGGADHPRADQYRGGVPERTLPARQQGHRDEDAAGQVVRAGNAEAYRRVPGPGGLQVRHRLGPPDPLLRARPVADQGPAYRYRAQRLRQGARRRSRRIPRSQPQTGAV